MRSIGVVLALVLVASSPAYAEGPIAVRAGIGITAGPDLYGPGFQLDIAYRFVDHLAAGVHFGVTRYEGTVSDTDFIGTQVFHFVTAPVQLGVNGYWSADRVWLAPWLGVEDRGDDYHERAFAFGLGAGFDVYGSPTGHRVGISVDVTSSSSVSASIAYRYW